jgi:hypothetical protein
MRLSKSVIIGYITSLAGTALWLYGYFEAGHPVLIDWHTYTPWWIADFLPNMESEIGMRLVFASTAPNPFGLRRFGSRNSGARSEFSAASSCPTKIGSEQRDARALHERALAIREKLFGRDHRYTAWALNLLARDLLAQRDLAAARPPTALVRTVSAELRDAQQRIRDLERRLETESTFSQLKADFDAEAENHHTRLQTELAQARQRAAEASGRVAQIEEAEERVVRAEAEADERIRRTAAEAEGVFARLKREAAEAQQRAEAEAERMDNASALPTCPQRQQQKKTAVQKWSKITHSFA